VVDFSQIPMDGLLQRLGFVRPKRGTRANCVLCGSTGGTCFSYCPDGRWHCFRCGAGGGKLRLVELVLGVDRRAALDWLSREFGIPLRREWTREEKSAWRERRSEAEAEGRELLEWKTALIANLRGCRDDLMSTYHKAKNYLLHHGLQECERKQDFRYEVAVEVAITYWPKVERLDAQIQSLQTAPYRTLLRYFRDMKRDR
jgi:phage/plasmid primase-like uncharacterized protein